MLSSLGLGLVRNRIWPAQYSCQHRLELHKCHWSPVVPGRSSGSRKPSCCEQLPLGGEVANEFPSQVDLPSSDEQAPSHRKDEKADTYSLPRCPPCFMLRLRVRVLDSDLPRLPQVSVWENFLRPQQQRQSNHRLVTAAGGPL